MLDAVQPCEDVQTFESTLQYFAEHAQAFRPAMATDLGAQTFRLLLDCSQEGLRFALSGVQVSRSADGTAPGGVPAACAVFDGLRMARRGASLTLIEAQDATLLTARDLHALRCLDGQVEQFLVEARRQFGAAASLRGACDALRTSGLEGIEGLVRALEEGAVEAESITQGLNDPSAVSVAGSMRRLEAEVRPLVEAMNPMLSRTWERVDGEVLWETRMVNVGDVVTQALRAARAEAGGWAICADGAAELRASGNPCLVSAAERLDAASSKLQKEGLRKAGGESLWLVRDAFASISSSSSARDDDSPTGLLVRSIPRWLREFVGAAAVLQEAAEYRLPRCCNCDVITVQDALRRSVKRFSDADPSSCQRPWAGADDFRQAVAQARQSDQLKALLNEVDRDVVQVLGTSWVADLACIDDIHVCSKDQSIKHATPAGGTPETVGIPVLVSDAKNQCSARADKGACCSIS